MSIVIIVAGLVFGAACTLSLVGLMFRVWVDPLRYRRQPGSARALCPQCRGTGHVTIAGVDAVCPCVQRSYDAWRASKVDDLPR